MNILRRFVVVIFFQGVPQTDQNININDNILYNKHYKHDVHYMIVQSKTGINEISDREG